MMRSFPYHELFMPTIPLPASAAAYLVRQKHPKCAGIREFLRLRADFIGAWTAFLARRAGPLLPVGGGAGDDPGDQQRQGGGLEAVRPAPLPQEAI